MSFDVCQMTCYNKARRLLGGGHHVLKIFILCGYYDYV
jgi:hypothetical protein